MTNLIGIRGIASYLPMGRLRNQEIFERFGFELDFLSKKLGIESRPRAAKGESTVDLCLAAVANLREESNLPMERIGAIFVVTQTPDRVLPQCSSLVQDRLALPKTTAALDINLGCSGFVYGLSTACAFMAANRISDALLITAERYSALLDPEDRNTVPLFGDAATATWLSTDAPLYLPGRFSFGTDGGRSEAVTAGGAEQHPLRMDGRAIFSFMMSEVPGDIATCLSLNDLAADQVDLWVFHQASAYMVEALAKRVGAPAEKVAMAMAESGNTTSSTIPIALEQTCMAAEHPPGLVLISGFGVGASWASGILRRA